MNHVDNGARTLTAEQESFFHREGYVIIPGAIPPAQCEETLEAIWHLVEQHGVDRSRPETWDGPPFNRLGFIDSYPVHHLQQVWDIRQAPAVYGAFRDLLGTERLRVSIDRVSLKRPGIVAGARRPDWQCKDWFHTDVNPHHLPQQPLDLQGFVVLTDTTEDQGTLSVIPGWHHEIRDWADRQLQLASDPRWQQRAKATIFPPEKVPCFFRDEDIIARRARKLAFRQGDLFIFNSLLVHGSGPNQTDRWRSFVYVRYQEEWLVDEKISTAALRSWKTGFSPGIQPNGGKSPKQTGSQDLFRLQDSYQPPHLTELGRRLLGLDAWD